MVGARETIHPCDGKELKELFDYCKMEKSMIVLIHSAYLNQKKEPHAFFDFPGTKGAMIGLPPLQRWPSQNGWSFSTWFQMKQKSYAQPYLFNFKTGKSGLGYSAHFTGSCLVLTSIKAKGKGVQHCVTYNFPSLKWMHCAITYHNKWRSPEIKVYINGQLAANIEMQWQVQTGEIFDKCFIGGAGMVSSEDRMGESNCFDGQMSAIYLFNESLTAAQICAIHRLGPSYMDKFKYSSNDHSKIPQLIRKVLFEEKLPSYLFCLYSPTEVDSGALCLQQAFNGTTKQNSSQNYFVTSAHAALLGNTKAIKASTISDALQSEGGLESLLYLFDDFCKETDSSAVVSTMKFICDLMDPSNQWFINSFLKTNGFAIISGSLHQNPKRLLSIYLLQVFIDLTKCLMTLPNTNNEIVILRHFMDSILFNPSLWSRADAEVQIRLYTYLASELLPSFTLSNQASCQNELNTTPYLSYNPTTSSIAGSLMRTPSEEMLQSKSLLSDTLDNPTIGESIFNETRRVSTVLQLIHSLKNYHWLHEEEQDNNKTEVCINKQDKLELDDKEKCEEKIEEPVKLERKHKEENVEEEVMAKVDELIQRVEEDEKSNENTQDKVKGNIAKPYDTDTIENNSTKPDKFVDEIVLNEEEQTKFEEILLTNPERDEELNLEEVNLASSFEEASIKFQEYDRPSKDHLVKIRSLILSFISELINRSDTIPYDEVQGILNYISTCNHEDNLLDVLSFLETLLINFPDELVPALDGKNGTEVLFHLLSSKFKSVRVRALRLISAFLNHCSSKGKQDVMQTHNLYMLIVVKLKKFLPLDWETYVALIDILIETMRDPNEKFEEFSRDRLDNDVFDARIENPMMIKVITALITEQYSKDNQSVEAPIDVRSIFIDHLWNFIANNKENRRSILQMSVWQHSMICLICSNETSQLIIDKILAIFRVLLYHALRYEFGGWRVWIDTLAIIHTKFSCDGYIKSQLNLDLSNLSLDADKKEEVGQSNNGFKIPEFKWCEPLIKLLNDLMFSVECDLFHWRCLAKISPEIPPFPVRNIEAALVKNSSTSSSSASSSASQNTNQNHKSTTTESFMAEQKDQIYIVNIVHFVTQLADHIVIASGGLLPLLAEATGGNRSQQNQTNNTESIKPTSEGLEATQADSILFRLVGIIDIVVFASSHINLSELESEKNISSGCMLRQSLRLVLQSTVKNCLVINKLKERTVEDETLEFPKEIFDCYHGCSIISANSLFEKSCLNIEDSDLIANVEYSPHQTPNASFQPSILPFQSSPIKDYTKLLQKLDISRIQACIYHNFDLESRQSQFLALSSLYFISVLMVSRYRDIIETRHRQSSSSLNDNTNNIEASTSSQLSDNQANNTIVETQCNDKTLATNKQVNTTAEETATANNESLSMVEKTSKSSKIGQQAGLNSDSDDSKRNNKQLSSGSLTVMLTKHLEDTFDTICPLLRLIMCDFSKFLAKTLLGSHGQDLVTKEIDRTFRNQDTSPIMIVMLLCSQEWQNTLQKNAGLAFIELINEGRVLSLNMKEHIVRVAVEAEYILGNHRSDDEVKHEIYNLNCQNNLNVREHEEILVNSLIRSSRKKEHMVYKMFAETRYQDNKLVEN